MSDALRCVNRYQNGHGRYRGSEFATVTRTYQGQQYHYCDDCAKDTARYDWGRPAEFVVEVSEGTYRDYRYETACNYDTHKLIPGVYPIVAVTIGYRPLVAGEQPYYYYAVVPTIMVESYYVNRLFTATSVSRDTAEKPSTVNIVKYGFEVHKPQHAAYLTALDGLAKVLRVAAPVAA